jgi:hypothetical protein
MIVVSLLSSCGMDLAANLPTALFHGALLSAWMTFVVLASLRQDPRIWTNDAPKALQEVLGPMPDASRKRARVWVLVTFVGLVAISAHLMIAGIPSEAGFGARMLAAYVMFEVFNCYDAVVLDIGVILLWAPDWAFVPGTKNHPSLRDWRFHVRAFAIGVFAGVPFALLVAGLWAAAAAFG